MGGFSSFGDRLYFSSEDIPAPAYRLLENYSTNVLSRGGCPLGALVQINLRQNFLSVENVETSAVKIDRAKTRPRWPPGSARRA